MSSCSKGTLVQRFFFLQGYVYPSAYAIVFADPVFAQMVNVNTYNYHPPMPLPDPEAPEQSLGDCVICMDAITIDPALRQRSDEKGDSLARRTGGLLAQGARKNYSLAPCHHLFVSVLSST